jgi:alkanesulfonate monooxygenase SsuD/methylene tetrahydromethanopterin reductase-like flavin-dependent oxidoreductase (luciferase family)
LKCGIYVPNFGAYGEATALVELGELAEKAGWDGLFVWDHIAGWPQPIVDPWVALTAIATRTSRIRIGTTVTPVPRRRPWKLARETVSLDRLSGGRLILGVGIGGGEAEWGSLGEETDLRTRGQMLDEGLEVLTGLWSGESFSFDGAHYTVREARFMPTPLQAPRVPIWVGGFWPNKAPFRRMARWDGMFPLFAEAESVDDELAQLREALAFVRSHRASDGPFDVVATGVTPGENPSQAAEFVSAYETAGATWWLEAIAPYRIGQGLEGAWPVAALRERVAQGPPRVDA